MDKTVTARRRIGLVCLAVAPALLLAATAADPALGGGDWDREVGAAPDAALLHTVLLHWAWVLFVPGLLTLLRSDGWLTRVARVAVLLGLTTFAGLVLTDVTAIAVASTVDDATMAVFDERVGSYTWMTLGWQLPGLVGWALALVLTPIAAVRARVAGWWYAAAAIGGTALYFAFAISAVPLSLTGPAVLVAANVALAVRLWSRAGGPAPSVPWRVGAYCLVAAPVSLAVGLVLVPGDAFGVAALSSDPGGAQASAFFLHLAWLLFIPGVLAVTARIGSWFGLVAGGVAVLGLLHFNGLMIGDYLALAVEQVLPPATRDALDTDAPLFASTVALPGMVLSLLGLILVPVAAARAGLVRWYVPVVAGLGVVAFLVVPLGKVSGLVAPALLLIGFGLLARVRGEASHLGDSADRTVGAIIRQGG